jgi:hypothetical protein
MTNLQIKPDNRISPTLAFLGSLVILGHFGAVAAHALAAPSGPWPSQEGMGMADPPAFTVSVDGSLARDYLSPLKLTHNYHFAGNRPMIPGVYLEFRLRDAQGEPLATVRLPDSESDRESPNSSVRYLQNLFVQGVVPDQPVAPFEGETVPAPNQQVKMVSIWDAGINDSLRLSQVPEHLVPRNRPVFGPTEWSLILVRSYTRFLCRKYGAASAEVVRYSRDVVSPNTLLVGPPPPAAFKDLVASYGEIHGD